MISLSAAQRLLEGMPALESLDAIKNLSHCENLSHNWLLQAAQQPCARMESQDLLLRT